MRNKSLKKIAFIVVILIVNLLILLFANTQNKDDFTFKYNVSSNQKGTYQVFYTYDGNFGQYVIDEKYNNIGEEKTLFYTIPSKVTRLRLDLGESPAELNISNVKITYYGQNLDVISLIDKDPGSMNDISSIKVLDDNIYVTSSGNDPFLTLNLNNAQYPLMEKVDKYKMIAVKILMCLIVDVIAIISIKKRSIIKVLVEEIYNNRKLVMNLGKNDFKTKYAGSYLGIT